MNNPSFCSLEYFSILRNKMSKSHYFEMYKVFIIILFTSLLPNKWYEGIGTMGGVGILIIYN